MFQAGPALEWHQKEEEYELELVTQEGRNTPPSPFTKAWACLVAVFGVTPSKSSGPGEGQGDFSVSQLSCE